MDPKNDIKIEKTNKKNKKKKHVGLWVSLGIIFTLIIAPISAIFICFYDGKRANIQRDENFNAAIMFKETAFDALDNVEENGILEFSIEKDELNQAFAQALDSFTKNNEMLKKTVTDLSLETIDNEYTFVFDIELINFFKTRLYIVTEYSQGQITKEDKTQEDALIFSIKNVKLGRIGGIDGLINSVAPKLVSDETLSNLFKNFGFSFKWDLKNKRFYYLRSSLKNDVSNKLNISSPIFDSIIQMFFNPNIVELAFMEDGFRANVDLEPFAVNDEFITNEKKNDVNWKALKSKTLEIINGLSNSIGDSLPLSYDDIYDYIVNGYDKISPTLKDKLKSLDFTPYGITSFEDYNGVWTNVPTQGKICRPNETLKQQLANQISPENIALHKIGTITEEQINKTLMATGSIGEFYTINGIREDESVSFTPMTITNMYCNVLNDTIKFVITISVNGYDTNICISATFDNFESESYNTTFKLKVDDIYYGSHLVDDEFANRIFDLVSRALNVDETFFFNMDSKEISMNFLSAIEDSGFKEDITSVGKPALKLTGDSLADSGELQFIIIPASI